jgi:hypothetical protein
MREQRVLRVRSLAERLVQAWGAGRRDRALENSASALRDLGPLPIGATVDTGLAGRALTDTLARRGIQPGVGVLAFDRGMIVYHVHELVPGYTPNFEQIRPLLAAELARTREAEDERTARALYESAPQRFASGKVLHFTRVIVPRPEALDVPLTREEVEDYYRSHIDKYAAPEMVRARHILITPRDRSAAADQAARDRAEQLLRRARGGEDFAELARLYSEDPATRAQGGDLGFFARGAMLPPVERAAFALSPGGMSDVVRSEAGYHIIKVVDHLPLEAEPLAQIYANVGSDAASEKAARLARHRADSLYYLVRTPKAAAGLARKLGLVVMPYTHVIGNTAYPADLRSSFERLEKVPLGKLYPGVLSMKGTGAIIQWPDSITPARAPRWEDARESAFEAYHRDAGRRALGSKRAEMDSLLQSGWSLDSLGALWGGLEHVPQVRPGVEIAKLGGAQIVDSLVFGGLRAPALEPGQTSDWVELPKGLARIRLNERARPTASELASRMETERGMALDRALLDFFEDLKRRFPVRILDPRLRDVVLPAPPEPSSP